MSEGAGFNLGLFPSRNALFWLCAHLACFGEKWQFEKVGSWDLCCHLADKEPEVQAGAEAPTQLVHDRSKTRLQNSNHEIGWDFLCTPLSPLTDFLT